jgi:hypothetical protein
MKAFVFPAHGSRSCVPSVFAAKWLDEQRRWTRFTQLPGAIPDRPTGGSASARPSGGSRAAEKAQVDRQRMHLGYPGRSAKFRKARPGRCSSINGGRSCAATMQSTGQRGRTYCRNGLTHAGLGIDHVIVTLGDGRGRHSGHQAPRNAFIGDIRPWDGPPDPWTGYFAASSLLQGEASLNGRNAYE